jgi:predicted fused transcriptional regulator/phosphomethylpyrimidine kinase/hydrogenase maturation factor
LGEHNHLGENKKSAEVGKLSLAAVLRELAEVGVKPELDANEADGLLAAVNPAVGVPDDLLGFFAFHYSASNVAAAFGKPEFALLDLVLPPGYPEGKAFSIIRSFASECRKYGVRLVGGHTGRYEGAEYPIASSAVIGRRVRARRAPAEGDDVYLVGVVGAEAAWLTGAEVELEELTPLPKALKLQGAEGLKLLHDVSEGGLLGALLEVSTFYRSSIAVERGRVPVHPRAPRLGELLSLPSYGALVAVAEEGSRLEDLCSREGLECSWIGRVGGPGVGVEVDGVVFSTAPQSELVALYTPSAAGREEAAAVALAASRLIRLRGLERFVPEVGMNIAYAKPSAKVEEDVAAIEGRIVRTARGLRLCGKPAYGASRHLARVLIEAAKRDPRRRAAVNLRPSPELLSALRELGLKVVEVEPRGACPVAEAIAAGVEADAYFYGAAPGLEPSLVIIADSPASLVELLEKALSLLPRKADIA